MELIFHHFTRFGLKMHIGQGKTASKTECIFFPPPQFFQHNHTREKAATAIQQAYPHTHKSWREKPLCALKETIEMTTKPKHKHGTIVSKTFNDDNGIRHPFTGAVKSYDKMRKFNMIIYEDGDSEELTHEEVLSLLKTATSNRTIHPTSSPNALSLSPPTTFPVACFVWRSG